MKQKLLHIMMGTHNPDMRLGLDSIFECKHWDWTRVFYEKKKQPVAHVYDRAIPFHQQHLKRLAEENPLDRSTAELRNADLLETFNSFNPNIVFIHTQSDGIIDYAVIAHMMKTAVCVNWSGDVRSPLPLHYKKLGKLIDTTLFTNMNDVNQLNKEGIKSDFLQVGFDSKQFNPIGPTGGYPEIIFMGSDYKFMFPLSAYRKTMVEELKRKYGKRVGIYGSGWGELADGLITSYQEEGMAYRSCKIAISLSHFDYSRYASDRLFRILGSGAFCLSHNYTDISRDFEVGVELDVFNTLAQLFEKIDFYLKEEEKREYIAYRGCKKGRRNFTWHHFAENLKKIMDNINKPIRSVLTTSNATI